MNTKKFTFDIIQFPKEQPHKLTKEYVLSKNFTDETTLKETKNYRSYLSLVHAQRLLHHTNRDLEKTKTKAKQIKEKLNQEWESLKQMEETFRDNFIKFHKNSHTDINKHYLVTFAIRITIMINYDIDLSDTDSLNLKKLDNSRDNQLELLCK